MEGYLNAPDTTFVSAGVLTQGWKTLYQRYQEHYGKNVLSMGHLRFQNVRITPLGKDHALCVGQWFLEGVPGQPAVQDGVFTLIWQRTTQGWKIIHDHTSTRREH